MGSELVASEFELLVLVASSTAGEVEAVGPLDADGDEDGVAAEGVDAAPAETFSLVRI